MKYDTATLIAKWDDILLEDEIFGPAREDIGNSHQDTLTIKVPYPFIERYDPDFGHNLLKHPEEVITAAETAMIHILKGYRDDSVSLNVRIHGFPRTHHTQIRELRSEHIGTFVSVPGVVTKATVVEPKITIGAFMCVCGHIQCIRQPDLKIEEPYLCREDDGGCGRKSASSKFTLLRDQSSFKNTQKIEIQERQETMLIGSQPQRIIAYLYDDLAGAVNPGDDVVLNGEFSIMAREKGNVKSTIFRNTISINSIDKDDSKRDDVDLSDEDIAQIQDLAERKDIYQRLVRSIAPAIHGMDLIKEAMVFQLFGGVPRKILGTYVRGDIHILLMGDPGTAKSQLLRFVTDISPRAIFASGQASSKAGLTATAVKDEFGEGRWTLEAGAFVLADGGIAAVDELDKMRPEDRSSMHECLEQQRLTINKAGLTATFSTRTSLLAAANPKKGRFDKYKPFSEQFNMDSPLLTRFDVIVIIIDEPERIRDTNLATHITTLRMGSEVAYRESDTFSSHDDDEDEEDEGKLDDDSIDPQLLTKYISYARNTIFPSMSQEVADYLTTYYADVRNAITTDEEDRVTITPRQLEAIIRLSEASAKIRLSQTVELEDAIRAIRIIKTYIEGLSGTNGYDFDVVETGYTSSQREHITLIEEAIQRICHGTNQRAAPYNDIINLCREKIKEQELSSLLEYMSEKKMIFKTTTDEYGVMSQ